MGIYITIKGCLAAQTGQISELNRQEIIYRDHYSLHKRRYAIGRSWHGENIIVSVQHSFLEEQEVR